jgi:hypothetical protein
VLPWRYSLLPELLGFGLGFEIGTEDQFEAALAKVHDHLDAYSILAKS